jgi:HEAT repeat protein
LQDPSYAVRAGAVRAAAGIVPAEAVPHLVTVLKTSGIDLRADTARALQRFGPAAREAVPALIDALKDENKYVRGASAVALGRIGPDAKEAVPELSRLLDSEGDDYRRFDLAEALFRIEGRHEPVEEMIRGDEVAPSQYDDLVLEIGPGRPWVVPALVEALEKRAWADQDLLAVLEQFGPAAGDTAPVLVKKINKAGRHSTDGERYYQCLATIDPAAAARLDRRLWPYYVIGAAVLVVGIWSFRRFRRARKPAA